MTLHNQWGKPFGDIDLRRWLRLNRLVFNVEKVDALAHGNSAERVADFIEAAREWDLRLSLRTDCATPPPDLAKLKDDGLLDAFLVPANADAPNLNAWLAACTKAGLPARLQLPAHVSDANAVVARAIEHRIVSVNVAAFDPFTPPARGGSGAQSRASIGAMQTLALELESAGIECNLLRVPFCQFDEQRRANVLNARQFHLDHQQYTKASYEQALNIYRNAPAAVSKIMLILLARSTFQRSFVDAVLLRLLLQMRLVYGWSAALHKLTRHLRNRYLKPKVSGQTIEQIAREIEKVRAHETKTLGPNCSKCSLRRICDRDTPEFKRALPGLDLNAVGGELVVSPMHFALAQPKYYDAIDEQRLKRTAGEEALVKEANAVVENRAPDRQIMPYEYTVVGAPWEHLEGGVRWHSITNTEKQSTQLEYVEPPFTISVTFGGGIAEYIGLSFGRHCKLLCPMEGYRHTVVLHVAADGHYVLLRDGKPVRPVEFEGMFYVPMRLGGRLDPRIAAWNIDAQIVTQFVKIWRGEHTHVPHAEGIKYSIIVVNSRYARRLQAMLRAIAHQRDIDLGKIEVIIAYIPGLDATDDLIDSMRLTYPGLRIVRSPFPAQNANAKGFMINESASMASGEWIVLMDADIVIAPTMFARIDEVSDSANFVAGDGRLMLSKETTAKILTGEIRPWDEWDQLVNSGGEYRYREAHGVPVGFFQCFKREFFDEVKYAELDHFEGADMWFGMALQGKYGKEVRLSGLPVLHLDHGGSQWYGTTKHF